MDFDVKKLDKELDNVLTYWLNNAIFNNRIVGELSINNIPNPNAEIGSMYLARIMYGASAACKTLKTDKYKILADISFNMLMNEYINPDGGYYWSKSASNEILHNTECMNMAQAFVLYGLVEYASLNCTQLVLDKIEKQSQFILSTIKDEVYGGFLDGFNQHWISGSAQTKGFGTHLHLLEAFAKLYELNQNDALLPIIKELIHIILKKFITHDTFDCLHSLTPDWKPLPNFVWAGHNAECSWILCKSASIINDKQLMLECNSMAIKIMENVMKHAYDGPNGGVFNALGHNIPTEEGKIWWPQAETVTALLNCFEITNEIKYKNSAIQLINYITTNFIHEHGEWFTEITKNRKPDFNIPKVHFWKAIYHNVRYYAELKQRLG